MLFESAKVSLPGHRPENQDRVDVFTSAGCALIVVVDGMGGHAEGARASEVTVACLKGSFSDAGQPVLDPQGFLISALGKAHDQVVELGKDIPLEHRPRATCAVCLIQDGNAYCAHVGDSRIYQLRDKGVVHRSRDHSHVELLLHEGVIKESDVKNHPMRNYVECCLGGDKPIPDMSIAVRSSLLPGDVLLVCSDGMWSGLEDDKFAVLVDQAETLSTALDGLAQAAVAANAPYSDNTSAAALRFNGVRR